MIAIDESWKKQRDDCRILIEHADDHAECCALRIRIATAGSYPSMLVIKS